jgi:hypothetical protein
MNHRPPREQVNFRAPAKFVAWLSRTSKWDVSDQEQLVVDLCEAKACVSGYCLPNTRAEIAAFDKIVASSRIPLSGERRVALIRALATFQSWQSYARWLPSDSEVRKLMRIRTYLRGFSGPLRANLAALELDEDFRASSRREKNEYRRLVIEQFEAGHPCPFHAIMIAEHSPSEPVSDEEGHAALAILRLPRKYTGDRPSGAVVLTGG